MYSLHLIQHVSAFYQQYRKFRTESDIFYVKTFGKFNGTSTSQYT